MTNAGALPAAVVQNRSGQRGRDHMKNYCHWCHQADGFTCPSLTTLSPELSCLECQRPIILLNIQETSRIVRKSRRTIYKWIGAGLIQSVPLADDRRLIVYSSLFNPHVTESQARSTSD
jgi:hypothetical protein